MTHSNALKLEGQVFSRLTVVSRAPSSTKKAKWNCVCECGGIAIVTSCKLRSGHTRSCGCLHRESSARNGGKNKTHGLSRTETGRSWSMMVNRCCNPNMAKSWERYGGKGITVCDFLKSDPRNLVAIIGIRPSKQFSIDRINNRDGYHCGQCRECERNGWSINIRWATATQQGRNKSSNRKYLINGETLCQSEWAIRLGIDRHTVARRFKSCLVK